MSKQLIVNADDYGRTEGVTRGIIQAHREGIVTSTTVMMNMPQVEDALGLAGDYPDLGMGVHLVFTAWRPLLPPAEGAQPGGCRWLFPQPGGDPVPSFDRAQDRPGPNRHR